MSHLEICMVVLDQNDVCPFLRGNISMWKPPLALDNILCRQNSLLMSRKKNVLGETLVCSTLLNVPHKQDIVETPIIQHLVCEGPM